MNGSNARRFRIYSLEGTKLNYSPAVTRRDLLIGTLYPEVKLAIAALDRCYLPRHVHTQSKIFVAFDPHQHLLTGQVGIAAFSFFLRMVGYFSFGSSKRVSFAYPTIWWVL